VPHNLDLRGIIPATVTPFSEDGQVDLKDLRNYMRWLSRFGIVGVAINVDTGEGLQLYQEERLTIAKEVASTLRGGKAIIAGLGSRFNDEARRSALEYKEAGADALLVFPIPAFAGSPLPPEVPLSYHQAAASAGLPLVLFQLQSALGGVQYDKATLARLSQLEAVVAIKEASFDAKKFLETVRTLRQLERKILVLTGNDSFIYESFLMGAEGALIGFGTLATDMQVEMHTKAARGDLGDAQEIWERLLPLEEAIFAPPVRDYRARTKEALAMMGVIRNTYVRPPLTPITSEEKETIRHLLSELGYL